MARYIDADALQAQLERKKAGVANQRYTEGWNDCMMRVKSMVSKAPTVAIWPIRHGKPIVKMRTVQMTGYREEMGVHAEDGSTLYRKNMTCVDVPYEYCPVCGATLCSRWSNYCGRCGAMMDIEEDNE